MNRVAVFISFVATVLSAEISPTKVDLFRAGEAGYASYRIPGVVVTAKGTILAYCEARRFSRSDWGQIDLMIRRNAGAWEPAQKLPGPTRPVPRNAAALAQKLGREGEQTLNNPVAIVQGEIVHVLYCAEYSRCFYLRSDDDGRTFSKPRDITSTFEAFRPDYDWKVIATGPGHGIQLANKRLLIPIWLSTGTGGHAHRPSAVSVIYSDGAAQTWKRGELVCNHPEPLVNPSEATAAQLADGRVMLSVRHESRTHRRAVSISGDGVTQWSKPALQDDLPEPVCMGSLLALPSGELLFSNPNSAPRTRTNLTVYLSRDQGRSWPIRKALEPGPSAYSDLASTADGAILCFYERGTNSLTLARFDLAWLTNSTKLVR